MSGGAPDSFVTARVCVAMGLGVAFSRHRPDLVVRGAFLNDLVGEVLSNLRSSGALRPDAELPPAGEGGQ